MKGKLQDTQIPHFQSHKTSTGWMTVLLMEKDEHKEAKVLGELGNEVVTGKESGGEEEGDRNLGFYFMVSA